MSFISKVIDWSHRRLFYISTKVQLANNYRTACIDYAGIYSTQGVGFEDFRPADATRCTNKAEIWRGGME